VSSVSPFANAHASRLPVPAGDPSTHRLQSIVRRNAIRRTYSLADDAEPFDSQIVADVDFLLCLVTTGETRVRVAWWSRVQAWWRRRSPAEHRGAVRGPRAHGFVRMDRHAMSPERTMADTKSKSLRAIAEQFQRRMSALDPCPKCGKSRLSVSIGIGAGPLKEVSTNQCQCPSVPR